VIALSVKLVIFKLPVILTFDIGIQNHLRLFLLARP
jgi:hypothetical protein